MSTGDDDAVEKKPAAPHAQEGEELGAGLTDDQRVSREPESKGDGANVTLGPADLERLPKP